MDIAVTIEGVTPLILNRFTDEDAESSSSGTRGSSANTDRGTPLEIAESKLYIDLNNCHCIPQPMVMACFVDGGRYEKIGKSQVTTNKKSLLYACLDVEGVTVLLEHKQPWKVLSVPVIIPATRGRILRHRPCFDDWKLSFNMSLDISIMSAKLLRQIVDHAGKRSGLGDWRPGTKGPYGKFVVTHWKEIKA